MRFKIGDYVLVEPNPNKGNHLWPPYGPYEIIDILFSRNNIYYYVEPRISGAEPRGWCPERFLTPIKHTYSFSEGI